MREGITSVTEWYSTLFYLHRTITRQTYSRTSHLAFTFTWWNCSIFFVCVEPSGPPYIMPPYIMPPFDWTNVLTYLIYVTEYKSYYIFELVPNGKYLYMIPARYSISVDFIKKSIVAHHFLCKKTVTTLAQSFFHSWYFQMLLNNLVLLANSYSPSTCI